MKKVSIIIPVYNVELYLAECLESVLGQTYKDLEIILIDDGSTDDSGLICDSYTKKDDRIIVIHQDNQGAAAAKNAGLDVAHGDYLAFVDSDDYVLKSWIADLMAVAEDNQADIVECGFWKMFRNGNEAVDTCPAIMTAEEYLKQYFSTWANSLFWNKLFTRDVVSSLRFHQERRCIDDEFFTYKVISNASIIVRLDKQYYYYRQRMSSAVRNQEHKYQITKDALDLRPERFEWIEKKFPSLTRLYWEKDVNYLLYLKKTGDFDTANTQLFKTVGRYYLKKTRSIKNDSRILMLCTQLILSIMSVKEKAEFVPQISNSCENFQDFYE